MLISSMALHTRYLPSEVMPKRHHSTPHLNNIQPPILSTLNPEPGQDKDKDKDKVWLQPQNHPPKFQNLNRAMWDG